jgi:hypothetical protein
VGCIGEVAGEWCFAARPAKTTNATLHGGLRGGFDRAILSRVSHIHPHAKLLFFFLFCYEKHTLHTTLLQRRHSPTISRAHLPTFPRVIRPGPPLLWLSSCSTDLTLFGIIALPSSISATVSIYSFSQRRVSRTSWCRNGARLAWNWRHVRDRASRVFRSTARAISLTMLNEQKGVGVSDGIRGEERSR